jgi:cell division initiation protein
MSRGSVDPLPGRATGDGLRITPLDIRNHAFRRRVSGYDREDVDAFLGMVADDFEGLIRELETLRHQKIRLEAKVEELSPTAGRRSWPRTFAR